MPSFLKLPVQAQRHLQILTDTTRITHTILRTQPSCKGGPALLHPRLTLSFESIQNFPPDLSKETAEVWLPTDDLIYFWTKLGHFLACMQAAPFWLYGSFADSTEEQITLMKTISCYSLFCHRNVYFPLLKLKWHFSVTSSFVSTLALLEKLCTKSSNLVPCGCSWRKHSSHTSPCLCSYQWGDETPLLSWATSQTKTYIFSQYSEFKLRLLEVNLCNPRPGKKSRWWWWWCYFSELTFQKFSGKRLVPTVSLIYYCNHCRVPCIPSLLYTPP